MNGAPLHHILTVTVENKPGVLSRVAGLFSRRGFNIVSLAVSPTDDERFSRMTIVVDAESAPLEQVVKQLNKLVPVIKITEVSPADGVERERVPIDQIGRDLGLVHLLLLGVGKKHHHDVGLAYRLARRQHREPGCLGLCLRRRALSQADDHVDARVLQVQRMRVPL